MGWSERYWDDVKTELQPSASEQGPASEDEDLDPVSPSSGTGDVSDDPSDHDAGAAGGGDA